MNIDSTQKKKILIAVGIFAAISVIVIVMFIANLLSTPKGYISLKSIPEKVTLTMPDGSVIEVNDTRPIQLPAGDYTLKISSDGFETITRDITVVENETITLPFRLNPVTESAVKESSDPKYDSVKEAITGDAMVRGGAEIEAANPILKHLPLYDIYIEVMACKAYRDATIAAGKIGLCITVIDEKNDFYVKEAMELLDSTGVPYDEYDIKINGVIYPNQAERAEGATFISER